MVGTVLAQLRIAAAVQSKAQRRPAEYDHFGGVGISMAGQSKSPNNPLLPEHRIHVLLLSANDLGFRATVREIKVAARCDASPWHGDVMPCNFQVVRAAGGQMAAGLNRQLQPSIRKSTPR